MKKARLYNRLSLKLVLRKFPAYSGLSQCIAIYIDGRDLKDILREYEAKILSDQDKNDGLLDSHMETELYWWVRSFIEEYWEEYKPLYGCKCGELGCWEFNVQQEIRQHTIVWKAFEQEHCREWDYSGLGTFVFEKRQFHRELKKLERWGAAILRKNREFEQQLQALQDKLDAADF